MKLRDITEGVAANIDKIKKFLTDFEVTEYNAREGKNIWYHPGGRSDDGVLDFMNHRELTVKERIKLITIAPEDEVKFYWPFDREAYKGGLSIAAGNENLQMQIEDFTEFPDIDFLALESCMVKSFKGIDKLSNLKRIEIDFRINVDGGILSLLKYHGVLLASEIQNERTEKAFGILMRHFDGNKNIPDCMDELIEAGLKEYAKL
jgi:hypothetical protein